ncbi:MAG TPA: hypothetical protein VFA47_07280 [Candidatus Manganitrophaceae bacterium]|nr:hypothetical protein [Candidatus Manganitrophaceae bacterium]
MSEAPLPLTADERALIKDTSFFRAKVAIGKKVKENLVALHEALKEELALSSLLAPEGTDLQNGQFVKGEHLQDFPYQYLDFPKFFSHDEKFTFRSLFWWGHHFVFAWILEGAHLEEYKKNLLSSYDQLADQGLSILLAPTPWEWRNHPELILKIQSGNKGAVAEAVAPRPWLKVQRIIGFDHPLFVENRLTEAGRETFRLMKAIVSA